MSAHPITVPDRLSRPPSALTLLNKGLGRLWRAGLLPLHRSGGQWLAAMERNTEGPDPGFLEDLRRLIQAIDPDRGLTMIGRRGLWSTLEEAMRRDHRIEAARARHPGISNTPIAGPLFIVGMPRTGTTFLQSLLGRDPASRWLAPWELDLPLPSNPETWGTTADPRRRAHERAPRRHGGADLDAIHPLDSPAECWRLLLPTFVCHTLFLFFGFAGYPRWVDGLTPERGRAAYAHYRRQLQYLAWQRPGTQWVLKAPEHAFHLPALLAEFPDARVVLLHRDPLKVVPSFASLAWRCQSLCVEQPEPAAIGRGALAVLARCGEAILEARRSLGPDRFHDLHYADLIRDPLGAVEGIYTRFDMAFGEPARVAMAQWLERQRGKPRTPHRYDPRDFDLGPADIDAAFANYRHQFQIPSETVG